MFLHCVKNPSVRVTGGSVFQLGELNYTEGNVSELVLEADETSTMTYQKKSKGSIGANAAQAADGEQSNAREQLEHLIGLNSVKKEIDKMLRMVEFNQQRIAKGLEPQEQSFHSVFMGNPGTGKTTVARIVGELLYQKGIIGQRKFVEVSRSDLVAGYVGQR